MNVYFISLVALLASYHVKCTSTSDSEPNIKSRLRKNVLMIIVDDLRAFMEFPNHEVYTPNIDNLAFKGIVFNKTFAQQAICGPSRASFLTSRRPDSTGILSNRIYRRTHLKNFTTLPQYFKNHGYHTVSVGKVFHPGGFSRKPNKSDDYPYSWSQVPYHPPTVKYKNARVCLSHDKTLKMNIVCPVHVNEQPGKSLPDIQSSTYAVEFLKNYNKSSPFFLAIGFHKPHIPLKYPKEYLNLYPLSKIKVAHGNWRPSHMPNIAWNPWVDLRERDDIKQLNLSFPYEAIPVFYQKKIRQSYFAAISYLDDQVGKVLHQLESSRLARETIVLLMSDHGWSLGEHGEWSKFSNFEVSVKVPLIIYDPSAHETNSVESIFRISSQTKKIKTFSTSNALVELVDVFPTLVDLAGLPALKTCPISKPNTDTCTEGSSFASLLFNAPKNSWVGKNAVFSQYPRPSVEPQWNSDQPKPSDIQYMGYSMRTRRFRYTEWISYNMATLKPNWSCTVSKELYDHFNDSFEDHNLASIPFYENIVAELANLLRKGWRNFLP